MANLSNLFPNLTGDGSGATGDFIAAGTLATDDNRTTAEIAAGRQKIEDWARHGSGDVIPAYRLPDLTGNQTFSFTSTAVTQELSLAALVVAFNDAGTASAGITVTAGTEFNTGDIIILTDANAGGAETDSYIYVGADRTAAVSDADATNNIVGADFRDIQHQNDTIHSITLGQNLLFSDNSATIKTGAVTIKTADTLTAAGAAFVLGSAGDSKTTAINGSTLDVNSDGAITIDATLGGVSIDAAGGNVNLTAAAGTATVQGTTATLSDGTNSVAVGSTGTTVTGQLLLPTEETAATAGVATTGTAGTKVVALGASGAIQHVTLPAPGAPGAYAYATLDNTTTTVSLNAVNYIDSTDATSTAALVTQTYQMPTGTAGAWVKFINSAPATAVITLSTTTSTQNFVGTVDNTLIINDQSANFEMIYTQDGWAILAI